MNDMPFIEPKDIPKNIFRESGYFDSFCSVEAKSFILGQRLKTEKIVKRPLECFFTAVL